MLVAVFVVAVFFCATLVRSALGFGEALIAVPRLRQTANTLVEELVRGWHTFRGDRP